MSLLGMLALAACMAASAAWSVAWKRARSVSDSRCASSPTEGSTLSNERIC